MPVNGVEIKDAGALDEALTGDELVAFQEPAGGPGSTKHTTAQAIADLAAPGGGGGSYVHDQAAASTTWTVLHNLAMFPNVTAVDTAGTVINGRVQYDSNNQLTITFTTAQSGNAYVS